MIAGTSNVSMPRRNSTRITEMTVGRLSRSVTRMNATRGFAPAMPADSSHAGSLERRIHRAKSRGHHQVHQGRPVEPFHPDHPAEGVDVERGAGEVQQTLDDEVEETDAGAEQKDPAQTEEDPRDDERDQAQAEEDSPQGRIRALRHPGQ